MPKGYWPKGYWIARVDVTDPDAYQGYVKANAAAFAKYGGRFIIRGGQFEAPEGKPRARNVVIAFPDYASAKACYHSPEYQDAKAHRVNAAIADLLIIEGYDDPSP